VSVETSSPPLADEPGSSEVTEGSMAEPARRPGRRERRRRREAVPWHGDDWDEADEAWGDDVERLRRQHRWLGWLLALVAVLVVAAVLVAGSVAWWYVRQLNPPGDAGPPVNFTVTEEDTLETIAVRLEDEGIIANADVFEWYVERKGGLELEPGYYSLRPSDHVGNILRVLRTPPAQTYTKVTFPEGFTIAQMAARLGEQVAGFVADDFVQVATESNAIESSLRPDGVTSMEGLLFPDTYQIAGNETPADVAQRMASLMERVARQTGLDDQGTQGGLTPYETLIVASMIEKEAKVPEDRAKIARVIYNRLFLGMPLEIDATLYYGQDPDTPFSVLRDTDTPYNTYLHPGLPPTPIANPGRASIEAALHPAQNPSVGDPLCAELPTGTPCLYLFYVVADEDGRHAFAVTFEQHLANIEKARQAGVL
jgi:UPF0755 protein